jgi:TonB family protein
VRSVAPALLACLIAACAPRQDSRVAEAVRLFDATHETVRGSKGLIIREIPVTGRDFRDRAPRDDIEQWILGPEVEEQLRALRQRASESMSLAEATRHLEAATELIKQDVARSNALRDYWTRRLPAPYWRQYWQSFFAANGLDAGEPDEQLLAFETGLRTALDAGDFETANGRAKALVNGLSEAFSRRSDEIARETAKRKVEYQDRRSPCVAGSTPASANASPKLADSEPLESVYPRESVQRGEEGVVVLRIKLDANGCARRVAIAVHSGIEAIDKAALQWFETAQFSPATREGKPLESKLLFKIRFVLRG